MTLGTERLVYLSEIKFDQEEKDEIMQSDMEGDMDTRKISF